MTRDTSTDANLTPSSFGVVLVGGVPIQTTTPDAAVADVIARGLASREGAAGVPIRLVNAYSITLGNSDRAYGEVLRGEGINFPDGKPVAVVADRLTSVAAEQVRGPELFERTLEAGVAQGVRHYLYGTTQETLDLLTRQLEARFPGVQIVGAEAPAFAPVDELASDEVAQRIREARPDLLWVGLGTPKQDFVAVQLARKVGVPALGVGAAFDFSAGTIPVAPEVLRRFGMEWAYRFATEPRRLWRRYLIGNVQFIRLAAADLLRTRSSR